MAAICLLLVIVSTACGLSVPSGRVAFESTKWPPLQAHLDELPAFTCVNAEGEPLGYERDGKPLAVFFADIDEAEQQLEMARTQYPQLGLRLMGVGIGDVFQRTIEGRAVLVPSSAALAAAGDDWDSSDMPLYACLLMSKPSRDGSGKQVTPFFMDPAGAQSNLEGAVAIIERESGAPITEDQRTQLQLVCTSLRKAVELVLDGREKETCGDDRFEFIPPSRSVSYLQAASDELSKRREARRVSVTEAQAERPADASTGGLFPE